MIKVTIAWGECPLKTDVQTYTFNTTRDAEHFMWGANEANGWAEFAVIGPDIKDDEGYVVITSAYDGTIDEFITAVEEGRA
jgi:hypothetical protein